MKEKIRRGIAKACAGFIALCGTAHAADVAIMPLPAHVSDMKAGDFIAALKTVREQIDSPLFVSLWTWKQMEPEKGESKVGKESGGLNYAVSLGYRPYIGLTVIDTVKRVVPQDLDKLSWSDAAFITRYRDRVEDLSRHTPITARFFIIANEADVYLEKHPEEAEDFKRFVRAAKDDIRRVYPDAQTGVTVTYEGLHKGGERGRIARDMIEISDAAFLTYYPVWDMQVTKPQATTEHLDMMIKIAAGKDIILQEIGYASGVQGSSPEAQAEFFLTILPAIAGRPQIKVASIFALHDFDQKTCDDLVIYYGFGAWKETPWVRYFRDYVCTLGLIDAGGRPKPSWDAVVKSLPK